MGKEEGRIQVIDRAIRILDLFTDNQNEWRFTDIVVESGLNKSTAFNIINTLKDFNVLEQDEETKKYRLGPRLIRFGEIAQKTLQIARVARPFMEQIRDSVNETVQLARLDRNYTIYLSKVESKQPIQTYSQLGDAVPAHATGLGKAMLAYRGKEYIDSYFKDPLEQFTEKTISGKQQLLKELTKVQEQHMACDNGEFSPGLICFASPIFNHEGKAVYAISVSTPTYRMGQEKEFLIRRELKEKAELISRQMGYRGS